jgi:hypothetical protein
MSITAPDPAYEARRQAGRKGAITRAANKAKREAMAAAREAERIASAPTAEIVPFVRPEPTLVSWAADMCREPWPCDCSRGPGTVIQFRRRAARPTRSSDFLAILRKFAAAFYADETVAENDPPAKPRRRKPAGPRTSA